MIEFRIKEIRESKNISLYRLSKSTGIAISYLRNLENNKKFNPSLIVMYKIALVLEVNLEDLFFVDLEKIREKLHESISNNGIDSKETISTSRLLDILINIEMKKRNQNNSFNSLNE